MLMEDPVRTDPHIRFHPRRIGHVNLFVSDYLKSIEFYRDVCGFWVSGIESGVHAAFFTNGWTHHDIGVVQVRERGISIARTGHDIAPADYGKRVGLNHFGWEMDSELDLVEAYGRACVIGMPIHRLTDQGNSRSCYVFDDDGTNHQFYADKSADWRSIFSGGHVDLHGNPAWRPDESVPSPARNFELSPRILRNEAAPLHPIRLTHAVMVSGHIASSRRFYGEVAGLDSRGGSSSVCYLAGSASRYSIVLFESRGRALGMHHASFELPATETLDESTKALEAKGITIAGYVELPHKSSIFIRDPDGVLLEFYIARAEMPVTVHDDGSEAALYHA